MTLVLEATSRDASGRSVAPVGIHRLGDGAGAVVKVADQGAAQQVVGKVLATVRFSTLLGTLVNLRDLGESDEGVFNAVALMHAVTLAIGHVQAEDGDECEAENKLHVGVDEDWC